MKVAYLGPTGTFSEEALRSPLAASSSSAFPARPSTARSRRWRAARPTARFVPFENSIEGTVRPTLDALAFDTERIAIVGELDHEVRQALIARRELPLDEIEAVVSHPQATAQCARFLRESLPGADVRAVSSHLRAVRRVSESDRAVGGARLRRRGRALRVRRPARGVEDEEGNVTRFAWLAPRDAAA